MLQGSISRACPGRKATNYFGKNEVSVRSNVGCRTFAEKRWALHRQQHAVNVNVTSGLAFAPLAGLPVYCATKAALHFFTLSLRHQLKATGVRVVELIPPMVDANLGTRSAAIRSQNMMTPDQCATEALAQLEQDKDEVAVGMSGTPCALRFS
jgi:uncharacterized oxidoreductase